MTGYAVPVGTTPDGQPVTLDLSRAPHVLLAGVSGSGKSVGLHALVHGLVTGTTPAETRITFCDVKRVEFHGWKRAPHVEAVMTDPKECTDALVQMVRLMDERYADMERAGLRQLSDYPEDKRPPRHFIVVDELSDLLMQERKQANIALGALTRIAQLGRACGVHVICATQRPDSTVLPGRLKTNLLSRWIFKVRSPVDSRVALDARGAEQLTGQGDSLLSDRGGDPVRVQGLFIGDEEIQDAVDAACARYGARRGSVRVTGGGMGRKALRALSPRALSWVYAGGSVFALVSTVMVERGR